MTIAPYILNIIPPLALEDDLVEALNVSMDIALSHRAVVSQGVWQGNLCMDDVDELSAFEQVRELHLDFQQFFVPPNANLMDALKAFQEFGSNYLPVISPENGNYLGYLLQEDILNALCEMPFFSEEGVWVNLRMPLQEFSLSEVPQITELNNAKIYGIFVAKMDEESVELCLKIKSERFSDLVAAYERYGYVVSYESENGERTDEMMERYNQLIRFLNV